MQESTNVWILEYIRVYHSTHSRYDIDRYLLDAGCEPKEIEIAWLSLQKENLPKAKPSFLVRGFGQFLFYIAMLYIILLLAYDLYLIIFSDKIGAGTITVFYFLLPNQSYFATFIFLNIYACGVLAFLRKNKWLQILSVVSFILYIGVSWFYVGWGGDYTHQDNANLNGNVYNLNLHENNSNWPEGPFTELRIYKCSFFGLVCEQALNIDTRYLPYRLLSLGANYHLELDKTEKGLNIMLNRNLVYRCNLVNNPNTELQCLRTF